MFLAGVLVFLLLVIVVGFLPFRSCRKTLLWRIVSLPGVPTLSCIRPFPMLSMAIAIRLLTTSALLMCSASTSTVNFLV